MDAWRLKMYRGSTWGSVYRRSQVYITLNMIKEQEKNLDPHPHQSERSDPNRPVMEFRFLTYFTCQGTWVHQAWATCPWRRGRCPAWTRRRDSSPSTLRWWCQPEQNKYINGSLGHYLPQSTCHCESMAFTPFLVAVLRIRDVYPGSDFFPIPDSKTTFFTKLKMFNFLTGRYHRKIFESIDKEFKYF